MSDDDDDDDDEFAPPGKRKKRKPLPESDGKEESFEERLERRRGPRRKPDPPSPLMECFPTNQFFDELVHILFVPPSNRFRVQTKDWVEFFQVDDLCGASVNNNFLGLKVRGNMLTVRLSSEAAAREAFRFVATFGLGTIDL